MGRGGKDPVLPEVSPLGIRQKHLAAERSECNMKQSAEQLDVENQLRIGFDSSTEKKLFFKVSAQKIKLHHSL